MLAFLKSQSNTDLNSDFPDFELYFQEIFPYGLKSTYGMKETVSILKE